MNHKKSSTTAGSPFENSAITQYLTKQIDAISREKSQRQIAFEIGYEKPNMLSMFKRGETKIPLDKIPPLARSLRVDPAHLFRLGLEQYWHNLHELIDQIFGRIASENEEQILLKKWRVATKNMDPISNGKFELAVDKMLAEIFEP